MSLWDNFLSAIRGMPVKSIGINVPLETGYSQVRDVLTLIDAICDVYDNLAYEPLPDGTTFCNLAVQAVCGVMGYKEFAGLTADQIVAKMISSEDWSPVPFENAQNIANQGSLVVAGLDGASMNQAHGHVVIIRPGRTCYSGKWQQTPRCLNIGGENFIARAKRGPLKGLSCGLNEAFQELPKIYVWRQSL
jgi:hypothetical protein